MGAGCSFNMSADQLLPRIAEIQTVWTLDYFLPSQHGICAKKEHYLFIINATNSPWRSQTDVCDHPRSLCILCYM